MLIKNKGDNMKQNIYFVLTIILAVALLVTATNDASAIYETGTWTFSSCTQEDPPSSFGSSN